jgi:hypothetical protein
MADQAVTIRIWNGEKLEINKSFVGDEKNGFAAPVLPPASERLAILGVEPTPELIEHQAQIERLLDALTEAGTAANSTLTDLMAQHASKQDAPEDYSSGEDAGDPNRILNPPKAKRRKL